jgi:hypothetical protein
MCCAPTSASRCYHQSVEPEGQLFSSTYALLRDDTAPPILDNTEFNPPIDGCEPLVYC